VSLQQQKVGEAIRDAEVTLRLLNPNPNRHPNPNPNTNTNPNPNLYPNPSPNPNQVTLRLLERAVNRAAPTAPASRAISRPGSL